MAFLRNAVTTGPGTMVVVRSPHIIRAFLVDDYNSYLYALRQPFQPVDGGTFELGRDRWATGHLRAPYFGTWWLIVDSPATTTPQATFTITPGSRGTTDVTDGKRTRPGVP